MSQMPNRGRAAVRWGYDVPSLRCPEEFRGLSLLTGAPVLTGHFPRTSGAPVAGFDWSAVGREHTGRLFGREERSLIKDVKRNARLAVA